jgi:predicted permease
MLPIEMRSLFTDRRKAVFSIVARLKPDAGVAHAQANIGTVSAALARAYPETNESRRAIVRPIGDVLLGSNRLVMFAGVVLAAVVGVVLLIACSNVANLLLARSAVRRHEMAVRVALGASRGRLVRQLLTESLCLALLSGVAGLALGIGAMRLLHGTLPATGLLVSSMPSSRVLLFALAVSVITGIVFGIVPAMRASRDGLADVLRETRTAGPSGRRVSVANALLVGQVALSFVLLVTSGLFLRSLQHAYALDPGFQADRLALFIANPGQAGYTEVQTRQFYRDVRARVVTMPGVASVSWSANQLLFAPPVTGLQVEGRPSRARGEMPTTIVNTVDRDYFETAGVALLRGRDFTTNDGPDALRVAIVNDKLARDYWPGEEAIGKRLQVPGETVMRTVIGVARVANYSTWAEPPQRCVYVPLEQTSAETMTLFVRTTGDPAAVLVPIEKEVHVLAPRVLLTWNRTGRAIVDGGLFQARMGVTLLGVFGVLALGLACIGLYGNLAYLVQQRRREIGVRMALGASRGGVLRLILARGVSLVLVGIALGVAAALGAGRLLARLLYGVSSGDPVSLTGAAGALLAVALLACLLPAWRATRVDPLIALRE